MTEQITTAFDAEPGRTDLPWTSHWRTRYRHGDWPALSGPTSLVVLQPAAPQWSELIAVIWEEVLAAASLTELAARLAAFRLDTMPDFAALFWSPDGMRSLVRGAVQLIDPDTGDVIATGDGIQTWSEIGLGDRQRIEIVCGEPPSQDQLELPMIVGAATVSRILVDRRATARVTSTQGTTAAGTERPADQRSGQDRPAEDDQQRRRRLENAETVVDQPPVPPAGARPAGTALAGRSGADPSSGEATTLFASSLPGMPVSAPKRRPVAGVLHPSSGEPVPVDRPVVIGRAPSASRVSGDQLPRLLTVPSPSHDISRTHVQVAPDGDRLTVTDLHSTNGTILVGPDGGRRELSAGETVPLPVGSVIDLGDGLTIAVERE